MKMHGFIGQRVRYRGEEGVVSSTTIGPTSSFIMEITTPTSTPPREVRVPEYEWHAVEVLPDE